MTSKVEDSSNKSDVHDAKIASVELHDGWIVHTATFKLEYTDPEAKKEREEKAAEEAKKGEKDDVRKKETEAGAAEEAADDNSVITPENNAEFGEILSLKDEGDERIAAFAEKYKGRTVEFDGVITSIFYPDQFASTYEVLLSEGLDDVDGLVGPEFKYTRVNQNELNVVNGDASSLVVGTKLHCKAIVKGFSNNTLLFILQPVQNEII